MKLLISVSSPTEARLIAERLKSQGIYTFISNEESKTIDPMGVFTGGTTGVGIWIVVDNQYNDALMLLKNPDHEVVYQLTPEEIAYLDKQKRDTLNTLVNILLTIVIGGLLLGLIAYILYNVYMGS